jgi:plastocyanin
MMHFDPPHRRNRRPPRRPGQPHWRALLALLGLIAGLLLMVMSDARAAPLAVQVVNAAGQPVPGVVVAVRLRDLPTPPPPPVAQVEVTQQGMRFSPAVAIVTPGTRLRLTNRDRFDHHVRGTQGQSFEYRIAGTGETGAPPKDSAEVIIQGGIGPVQLGCHIHSRMQAHIYVADTPWYGLSDAEGRLTLPDVPEGALAVQLWHPQQLLEQPALPLRHSASAAGTAPALQRLALNFSPRLRP